MVTQQICKNGLNPELSWVFKQADDPLTQTASGFVCQIKQNGVTQQLASFYNRNVVKPEAWSTIQRDLSTRLPIYKASFKQSAAKYDLDWHLLAAIGYQESYLKPESVSPTGVRGLMMLTNSTARAMGVSNRSDPAQSIQGGAKYYDLMLTEFDNIPFPDRNWYALVAYNMGPGAVSQIQKRLQSQGKIRTNGSISMTICKVIKREMVDISKQFNMSLVSVLILNISKRRKHESISNFIFKS